MIDALLEEEGTLWAHNGGRYDGLWFLSHVVKRGITARIRCAGQRLTSIQVGKLTLRDSAALAPMSLEKFARVGKIPKASTGLECRCGFACGGYCAISRRMRPRDLAALVGYLEVDCLSLFSALSTLQEFADDHDLDLAGTVGASAWKCARRRASAPPADWGRNRRSPFSVYGYARESYFGGRTQVFRAQARRGFRYDINSSYPAALSKLALPLGEMTEKEGRNAERAYRNGTPGVYRASVYVPECVCPPLPVRTESRIAYPWGRLAGTWSANELAYAESVGVRVTEVHKGLCWGARSMVFADFCRYIWDLRDKAGPKTPIGSWLKWYANSLTGKLAQRPDAEKVVINPEVPTFCPANYPCFNIHPARGCCTHQCSGACGAWKTIDAAGSVFVTTEYRLADCAHVHWAAYLTAFARTELHRQLVSDGADGATAVYCDTDSVYATEERHYNVGLGLGQWKPEGAFLDFRALAPKTYSYIDEETGEFVARSKGIPDAEYNWDTLASGGSVVVDRGVRSFKSAAKSESLFTRKRIERKLLDRGNRFGDRLADSSGRTWPVSAEEMTP